MTHHDISRTDDSSDLSSTRLSLSRRLSLVSLLAVLVTAALLVFLYRQDQLAAHAESAAQENERTLSHLVRALDAQLNAYVSNGSLAGARPASAVSGLDALFAAELKAIHEDDVLKLKIYNLAGTAIYASAKNEIGAGSAHPDFVARALRGETVHRVEHRDVFFGLRGEAHDVEVALTYEPLLHEGKLIGVIEIYDDATRLFKRLYDSSVELILVVLGIFSLMYAALFFAIARADRAMAQWQRAVAESQNLLQSIIDAAPVRVFWKDRESRYLGCNPAFARDAGEATPQDIIGKTDHQLGWKEQAELYRADDRQVMESGVPKLAYDEPQTTPDGRRIWLRTSKVPLRNADNETIGVLGVYQDVSRRKEAEEKLRYSESRFRALMEQAPLSIQLFSPDGRTLGINRAWERMWGVGLDALAQYNVLQDKQLVENGLMPYIERAFAGEEAMELSAIFYDTASNERVRGGRKKFWVRSYIFPLKNELGKVQEVGLIHEDVSERRQAEAAMLRCKRVIETALDGFWLTDEKGYLLDANQAYAKMSGYAIDELVGMHISQLDAIDRPEDVAARAAKVAAQGEARFETSHRRKDGSQIDIEVSVTFMPETRQFFVFCHDITRRKQNERELRVAAATFETHEAILITDVNANIVRVNRAFTEITGYSAGEVLGKNPSMMHSGRHDRNFYVEMWQRLLHEGVWAGEIWDRRKNGEVYPKWMTITAVKNEQQEPTHYVAIFSDITARKRIEEEIHHLAFYDPLTKLPNRRLFLDRFRAALVASSRRNDYGAVLFIDLDRFKVLNDTHGHECGDLLLIEVGARIKSCVREMDTVARFGGDEFVVLVESFGKERDGVTRKVALVAEKIREALAQPYKLKGCEHHSSPSIGICLYHGNEDTLESLIEKADMAMYQAKNGGRNAVRFFDPVMQQKAVTHDALENDLSYAIGLQQLRLHYQVQVDGDNRPLGAEAFLRWQHPERGMLMPGQFLPVAEESGLIVDISRWVLQMACQQLSAWAKDDKTRDLTLTINISARHFALPGFVAEVADVLKTHKADPARLKMELSEQLVLTEANSTMEKIHALRDMGVKLTMDNFNMVYSSLSFIRELSPDQLKIHQAFVQGITQEGNDAQLVRAIIDLAKSMDMNVFAEGIETEAQRAFLKERDCNSYQGYLFGKPVPIEKFEEEIKKL